MRQTLNARIVDKSGSRRAMAAWARRLLAGGSEIVRAAMRRRAARLSGPRRFLFTSHPQPASQPASQPMAPVSNRNLASRHTPEKRECMKGTGATAVPLITLLWCDALRCAAIDRSEHKRMGLREQRARRGDAKMRCDRTRCMQRGTREGTSDARLPEETWSELCIPLPRARV